MSDPGFAQTVRGGTVGSAYPGLMTLSASNRTSSLPQSRNERSEPPQPPGSYFTLITGMWPVLRTRRPMYRTDETSRPEPSIPELFSGDVQQSCQTGFASGQLIR